MHAFKLRTAIPTQGGNSMPCRSHNPGEVWINYDRENTDKRCSSISRSVSHHGMSPRLSHLVYFCISHSICMDTCTHLEV